MAKGDVVGDSEEVVRASMYPYWDADLKRATPSAFTGNNVSVSRLAILNVNEIVSIFRQDFNKRTHSSGESLEVRGIGRATVADIIRQANEPMTDKNMSLPDVVLSVIEDAIDNEPGITNNPAHALICGCARENLAVPRKITRGMAKRLLDVFVWEPLTD